MEDEIMTEVKEEEKTEVIPTLTLDDEEPVMSTLIKDTDQPLTKTPEVPEQHFSEAEQRQIDQFAEQIDLTNMDQIMKYGTAAQKKSSSFSEAALKGVKTKDFGEIGTLLASLTTEVRGLDDKDDKGGFLGLFKKGRNKVEEMKVRYSDSETNINKIAKALEAHQFTLLKDISLMGKLYDENKLYFKELSMYIAAGQKKLNEVRNGKLKELQEKAQKS